MKTLRNFSLYYDYILLWNFNFWLFMFCKVSFNFIDILKVSNLAVFYFIVNKNIVLFI